MSLYGKVVARVFQLNLRINVINCRQRSCSLLLEQPVYPCSTVFKPKSYRITAKIFPELSTKTPCSQVRAMGALSPRDPSSFSRPEKAIIKHISLNLNVDFEKRVLNGQATLNFDVLEDVNDVILDISNLKIESVEADDGSKLQYKLGDHIPHFGSKLTIFIPKQAHAGDKKDASSSVKDDIIAKDIPTSAKDNIIMKDESKSVIISASTKDDIVNDASKSVNDDSTADDKSMSVIYTSAIDDIIAKDESKNVKDDITGEDKSTSVKDDFIAKDKSINVKDDIIMKNESTSVPHTDDIVQKDKCTCVKKYIINADESTSVGDDLIPKDITTSAKNDITTNEEIKKFKKGTIMKDESTSCACSTVNAKHESASVRGDIIVEDKSTSVRDDKIAIDKCTCVEKYTTAKDDSTNIRDDIMAKDVSESVRNTSVKDDIIAIDKCTCVEKYTTAKDDSTNIRDDIMAKDVSESVRNTSVKDDIIAKDKCTCVRDDVIMKDESTSVKDDIMMKCISTSIQNEIIAKDQSTSVRDDILAKDKSTMLTEKNFTNQFSKYVCDKCVSTEDLILVFDGFFYQPLGINIVSKAISVGSDITCHIEKSCGSMPVANFEGHRLKIKIKYSTDPKASALQWLEPQQTSGKKHPYLFSQCQPIHARSILPCQDTPAVKFTYDAEVTAPEEFTVLMSALRGEVKSNKTTFKQPMPLPSYLVAIAVGVLEHRTLGPRSKVWSEKEEIERSAWEFAETEKYLQAAEKLCGRYEWTQYDLLVLPPSFPYGGMENPCLTFVTPTLLAGDRSQADVIVHEIMHSWTGNLVTNRNFEHFWLNEGFTVFLERKVGASLINDTAEAKKSRDFHSLLGLQELNESIQVFGANNSLTNLVTDLKGIHPDDAFSRVPYEKGSLFLRYLEDLVGGPEIFDAFLRSYLSNFSKKSLDTDDFKAYLLNYFKDSDKLKNVDWNSWLYKSGMPPVIPNYDTTMTKAITTLIGKIDDSKTTISQSDVTTFTPHQMIHLLQELIDSQPLPLDRLKILGEEFKISGNKNSEIQYRWLRLCVRSKDQSKLSEVFDFVNSQGRMKYVRPIYRDLYAWEEVREQAIDNFLKNEKYMMYVSAYTLRKDLHLTEKATE